MAEVRQWLNSLSPAEGIMEGFQRNSRKILHEKNLPNNKEESWRKTSTRKITELLKADIQKREEKALTVNDLMLPQKPTEGYRCIIKGSYNSLLSEELPTGIRTLTKNELLDKLGQEISRQDADHNWPILINQATAKDAIGISIDRSNKTPLEIIICGVEDKLSSTRMLIFIEEEANLDLLQINLGQNNSTQSIMIEIHISKYAKLNHGLVSFGKNNSNLLNNLFVSQNINSQYDLTCIQNSFSFSRQESQIIQLHGQAISKINGLQVSSKNEQLTTHSKVIFNGPSGTLDQIQKSAATSNSHCIFNGAIKVPQVAQKTNASQLSRNLLMSDLAKIDTKPELEIIADDVKCSHGATVSEIQAEELFYLQSRGLSDIQAKSMLLKGYFDQIVCCLPVESSRWKILEKLNISINH